MIENVLVDSIPLWSLILFGLGLLVVIGDDATISAFFLLIAFLFVNESVASVPLFLTTYSAYGV